MNITVKRYRQKGVATDGHLYADNDYVCDTAENTCYCISPGTYHVTLEGQAVRQESTLPAP